MSQRKKRHENSPQLNRIAQLLARQAASEFFQRDTIPTPENAARAQYITPVQCARLVNKSVRTVRRWIQAQIVPSIKVGGSRLIAIADLERLLSSGFGQDEQPHDPS